MSVERPQLAQLRCIDDVDVVDVVELQLLWRALLSDDERLAVAVAWLQLRTGEFLEIRS